MVSDSEPVEEITKATEEKEKEKETAKEEETAVTDSAPVEEITEAEAEKEAAVTTQKYEAESRVISHEMSNGLPGTLPAPSHTDEVQLDKVDHPAHTMMLDTNPMSVAASNGDMSKVRELDEKDPRLIYSEMEWGWTVAHVAGACGQDEVLLYMASKDPLILMKQNVYGQTPLHYAAANGQIYAVRVLVRKAPNLLDVKCTDGRRPVDMAKHGKCRRFLRIEHAKRDKLKAMKEKADKRKDLFCFCCAWGKSRGKSTDDNKASEDQDGPDISEHFTRHRLSSTRGRLPTDVI